MRVLPLRNDLERYLKRRGLFGKFTKQVTLFSENPKHPSLNTELLEPRHLKLYSFRIDRKYRAIFLILSDGDAEIVDINMHYR